MAALPLVFVSQNLELYREVVFPQVEELGDQHEVCRYSARPIKSAWPTELSVPTQAWGKWPSLGWGGRPCRLHHRAGVTPKAKIRLVCSKNTLLKTLQCWKQARPLASRPGTEAEQGATLLSPPLFIWGHQALATWSCLRPRNACRGKSGHRRRGPSGARPCS